MIRVVNWFRYHENRLFLWVNQRHDLSLLRLFMNGITHLGGAALTIMFTLCFALFAPDPWNKAGLQGLIALAVSHLPVALIKKAYPRLRPYLVFPHANTCKNPLKDHSFPSGHTTAVFSVVLPFVAAFPFLGLLLVPLAVLVSLSRIYLGLHYPSDCAMGSFIGLSTALCTIIFIG